MLIGKGVNVRKSLLTLLTHCNRPLLARPRQPRAANKMARPKCLTISTFYFVIFTAQLEISQAVL